MNKALCLSPKARRGGSGVWFRVPADLPSRSGAERAPRAHCRRGSCPKPGPTRRFLLTPRRNSTAWHAMAPSDCGSDSYILGPNLASRQLASIEEAGRLGVTEALGLLIFICGSEGSKDQQPLAFQENQLRIGGAVTSQGISPKPLKVGTGRASG